jgi:hypothetical protein
LKLKLKEFFWDHLLKHVLHTKLKRAKQIFEDVKMPPTITIGKFPKVKPRDKG